MLDLPSVSACTHETLVAWLPDGMTHMSADIATYLGAVALGEDMQVLLATPIPATLPPPTPMQGMEWPFPGDTHATSCFCSTVVLLGNQNTLESFCSLRGKIKSQAGKDASTLASGKKELDRYG